MLAPLTAFVALAFPAVAQPSAETLPADRESASKLENALPGGLAAEDWTGIRSAYEASRHEAYPVEGGYQARNPGQEWRTRFDGRGFTTLPDAGGWTWGLDLVRYGFAGSEQEVVCPQRVRAEGGLVVYEWDASLEEWYVNDTRGLEHGYTIHQRPPHDGSCPDSPLTFELAVRGSLRPEVSSDGTGVGFSGAHDAVVLTYTGLIVIDARGHELEASFELAGEGLKLSIDERNARYPLTIDPIAQQAYVKASNTEAGDYFGCAASVSGETVVIGAFGEDSGATGVNGDQSDNSAYSAGAAYVFVRSGAGWSQQAYLKASNAESQDQFGSSVSVSGDTLVVGALGEDSYATGVNGDQGDNSGSYTGAAYVFVRSGTSWSQQAYLKASNTGTNDRFGRVVAVSGDTILVTASGEASNASGVNGNQNNNSLYGAGAAYVFLRSGTSWTQQAYVKASNPNAQDFFGYQASLSGDTLVVGAPGEASNATGVNGPQGNNSAPFAGAAYVFVRNGVSWSQQAYLKASNTDNEDRFSRVAVSGDTVVVGAYREDSAATGVNGDQGDNSAYRAGAAYVFVRTGASWSQQAYLKASNTDAQDGFGSYVAVSGELLVIGAPSEDSSATGTNGDQGDNSATSAGAAYLFVRSGTSWAQRAYLKASNTDTEDFFSGAVAMSDEIVLVGATNEDSSATGVNGDEDDDSADASGAAYVFALCALEHQAIETLRLGWPANPHALMPGLTNGPILGGSWDPVIDHETFATSAIADFVGIDAGHGPQNIPTGMGTLLIWPPPGSQTFFAVPAGTPFQIPMPNDCSLVGRPAWAQGGSFSPGGLIELANGLDLVLGTF